MNLSFINLIISFYPYGFCMHTTKIKRAGVYSHTKTTFLIWYSSEVVPLVMLINNARHILEVTMRAYCIYVIHVWMAARGRIRGDVFRSTYFTF